MQHEGGPLYCLIYGSLYGFLLLYRKRTGTYEDAPFAVAKAIEESRIVADFLPPPEKLVLRGQTEKITISLSRNSLAFFKERAKSQGVSYQLMIRKVMQRETACLGRGVALSYFPALQVARLRVEDDADLPDQSAVRTVLFRIPAFLDLV